VRQKGVFICKGGALVPQTDREREMVSKLKEGERVMVSVQRARYPEHHRLVFAVLSRLAKATGRTTETILLHLKAETGYVDLVQLPDGRILGNPQSIAFENMGQDEFQAWWKEAEQIIKEQYLPALPNVQYEEIRDILIGDKAA